MASIQGTSNERLRNPLVMGRSANGWIEWKAANGKTLDEVKRQGVGLAN